MSASDIRQAVIDVSAKEACGMVAVRAQTIWGANLIPLGAACGGGDDPRRKPSRSRAPAKSLWRKGSDDGTPTTPRRRALGDAASCWAAAVRLGNFGEKISTKKPATDFSVRALRFSR